MTDIAIVTRPADEVIARRDGVDISVGQFNADVAACADNLPDCQHVINLASDRYGFTTAFFAALIRGQTTLLPSSRDESTCLSLAAETSKTTIISDDPAISWADQIVEISPGSAGSAPSARVASTHKAAIAFTSGSTGEPMPHVKTWGMLAEWREVHWRYLATDHDQARSLVPTVPSWHMYGLEWAMLMPTCAPVTVHHDASFYPKDVMAALADATNETVLVSTPVHLRALTRTAPKGYRVSTVVCATAPLEDDLAADIHTRLNARILEIYGCSEIGSLAWRNPLTDSVWRFFDCFDVSLDDGQVSVKHPSLHRAVTLADRFSSTVEGEYIFEGRATDIVKVGGRRESLARLNSALLGVEGVEDGVFYQPSQFGLEGDRLGVVAVAPQMTPQQLRVALAQKLETTFLPRPIHLVDQLPRNTTSKLKKQAFVQLLEKLR
jgi:acyl-coenzyme A synthetase/AMP-(fatty) acid ligase